MKLMLAGWMIAASVVAANAQEEGRKFALIIGNDSYQISPLKNAVSDARAIDRALQAAGFKTELLENAKKPDMDREVGKFLDKLGPDDTALFFYAGHGVQIENENFLVPVDFEPGDSLSSAKFSCFSLAQIYDELARHRVKRRVVILDACRSNPLANKYSLEAGLARPQRDDLKESFIAYSTGPGQVATDNPDGKNSWFTESLSTLIATPGLSLDEIFNRVKRQVSEETAGKQTPWVSSTLTSSFYFIPLSKQDPDAEFTLSAKRLEDARRHEQAEEWDEAIDLIDQILAKKPGGLIEETAKAKRPYLVARRDARAKFEANDFAAAAAIYGDALKLDPFAIQAAQQGANSYLLADRLPDAVALLEAVRVRGTTEATQKASAMLQELVAVYPQARTLLSAGVPPPPPIEEVFGGTKFGMPDWDAGERQMKASSIDLGRLLKDVSDAGSVITAPAPVATATGSAVPAQAAAAPAPTPVDLAVFHVEIVSSSGSRDLVIRKAGAPLNSSGVQVPSGVNVKVTTDPAGAELTVEGSDQHCQSPCLLNLAPQRQVIHAQIPGFRPENRVITPAPAGTDMQIVMQRQLGYVVFEGLDAGTPVLLDGKPMTTQGAARFLLVAGPYEVKVVRENQVLNRQNVEVKDQGTINLTVKQ
jgi:tetratricopeptide (TPR) repeat protein